jgi:anti-sigma regulatory factor (Ser/Thr protein kinase)
VPLILVQDPIDVLYVQSRIRDFARDVGFDRFGCQELAIVASELASNILKYGRRGDLNVELLKLEGELCLELIARDCGPPFRDLDSALKDGWDDVGPIDPIQLLRRRGIGGGLGAVVRLTDSLTVENLPGGKQVIVRRYLHRAKKRFAF